MDLIDLFLHLDKHLNEWAGQLGPWLYVVLFLIVFAETGLVVTPFLPGDSLLFAVGALAATDGSPIGYAWVGVLLSIAAILGDATNYSIGRALGPKVFTSTTSRLLNREHLGKAQAFYEKHGPKTIVIARFVPIVRTFAPFVAGVGKMHYPQFALYNVGGGLLWVWSILTAGYFFGGIEIIKKNFSLVVIAIVVLSLLPVVYEWWKSRRARSA
ncbi:MAG: DedA family protein [Planctomycetes bacterium]|nr:DedA family protein [Planctomycetota bacterium]